MYLPPEDRPGAFGELARVLKPGGFFATAFKAGDDRATVVSAIEELCVGQRRSHGWTASTGPSLRSARCWTTVADPVARAWWYR